MPELRVVGYRLTWSPEKNRGAVLLIFDNHETHSFLTDASGIAASAAILNESPVSYRTETGILFTGPEPVGGTDEAR